MDDSTRLRRGKYGWDRIARQPPRWKDRTLGGGSKTAVQLHFWCRAINAGGQATRVIDTGLRSYVLVYLV